MAQKETNQENINSALIDNMFKKTASSEDRVQKQQKTSEFMTLSNQPYSKWQAIFNLEEIKQRNKPTLAKQDVPKAPFFLFDLDKVMAGDSQAVPDDLLK